MGFQSDEPASKKWKPMRRVGPAFANCPRTTETNIEEWENDRYQATVRFFDGGPWGVERHIVIGISRSDHTTIRDWRDLQYAKNDICGSEWEGMEVFPAESMKKDPSNRYYLFCFPPGTLSQVGVNLPGGRHICHPKDSIAPQRAFYAGAAK